MRKMKIKLLPYAFTPIRAHKTDAGLDLRSPKEITIKARSAELIDTGVCVELPKHTVGFIKSKSGLMCKSGITSEGVIDVGYQGSIVVRLQNNTDKDYIVYAGQKITQLVILPCKTPKLKFVDKFKTETKRGTNGFGSTGM